MAGLGGLEAAAARTRANSALLYGWAEATAGLSPFVADPDHRSPVIVTIDLDDSLDATELTRVLRSHGVVDTEPYRKLGRNQIRVATLVGIDTADVEKLIASIDYVLERL
jgi:phosphoserine aminotransferase